MSLDELDNIPELYRGTVTNDNIYSMILKIKYPMVGCLSFQLGEILKFLPIVKFGILMVPSRFARQFFAKSLQFSDALKVIEGMKMQQKK